MKDITRIVLKPLNPAKVARGHKSHLSGAGIHQDRRTRRLRTRGASFRRAMAEN